MDSVTEGRSWKPPDMLADHGLDRTKVEHLVRTFMLGCYAHMRKYPPDRDRMWEILNALGAVAGQTATGTGDVKSLEFFLKVVKEHTPPNWFNVTESEPESRIRE